MRGFIPAIFPRPRRKVTAADALPILAFLPAFLVLCWLLDAAGVVMFSRLWPFGLVLLMPWLWWIHVAHGAGGLRGGRALAALLFRLGLFGLLIVLLAEPHAVRSHDELAVVYAVDTSYSVRHEARDEAIGYVLDVTQQKPQKDLAGLLFFGADAAVELPPAPSFPFEAINVDVNRDGTNVAEALSLAGAMVPQDTQGRIVLITDGVETEGNLAAVLDDLKSKGIAVDVLPQSYEYQDEVWLERLDVPKHVKAGDTYEASVILSSLNDGQGTLVLEENGNKILERPVEYTAGKNRFVVPIPRREQGYYEYTARIVPERITQADGRDAARDTWPQNNRAVNHIFLRGRGKVLVVTDPMGNPAEWRDLVRALREAKREVEVTDTYDLPTDPLGLLPYDAVVLVNVPAETMIEPQMAAIREGVYDQGSGLLAVGGPDSFGPGGYRRTPIEEALPVSMDISQKKIMPKGALAIILHTCEFPQGNAIAKRITKEAIRVLDPRDEAGVLAYQWGGAGGANGDSWIFPLQPASNYPNMVKMITAAQIGDMPAFDGTMRMALNGLKNSTAMTKHMIIISDGDPSPPSPSTLNGFVANNITISTVPVNPHTPNDTQILKTIAEATGGTAYQIQNPANLPAIFIKEARTIRRSAFFEEPFLPRVEAPSPILKGIEGFPNLHGFVLASPKNRATVILRGPEKEQVDPVLAKWRFGVGASAAFTSDLSTRWGREWVSWDQYQAFVQQLITDIARADDRSNLRMRTFAAGGEGVIIVEDYAPESRFLEVEASVDGPELEDHRVELRQVGPRRYEGRFPLRGMGQYQVVAAGVGEGVEVDQRGEGPKGERAHGRLVVPYSQEFTRFRSNPLVMQSIADRTGGRILTGRETSEDIYLDINRESRRSSRPIVDWLLVLLALLIPFDVAMRRVQIDWQVVRGWFGSRRAAPSAETMGSLLKAKQAARDAMKGSDDEQAEVDSRPTLRARKPGGPSIMEGVDPEQAAKDKAAGVKPRTQQKSDDEDQGSMTARLLAAKKRAQQQKHEDEDEHK